MSEPSQFQTARKLFSALFIKLKKQPNLGLWTLEFGLEPDSIFPTGPDAKGKSILYCTNNDYGKGKRGETLAGAGKHQMRGVFPKASKEL